EHGWGGDGGWLSGGRFLDADLGQRSDSLRSIRVHPCSSVFICGQITPVPRIMPLRMSVNMSVAMITDMLTDMSTTRSSPACPRKAVPHIGRAQARGRELDLSFVSQHGQPRFHGTVR